MKRHRNLCGRKFAIELEEEKNIIERVEEDRTLRAKEIALNPNLNPKGVCEHFISNSLSR